MKILSIDTASNICLVAILENNQLIKELKIDDLKNHSEKLMPLINQLLTQTNLTLNNIDLLVCDKGPGSFTGIRIGVATTMAFADSLSIKAIGISSLEALTYNITNINNLISYNNQKLPSEKNASFNNPSNINYICTLIDANNDNVYSGLFELNNNIYTKLEDFKFQTIDNTINILKKYNLNNNKIIFVGDGAVNYKEKILKSISNCIFSSNNDLSAYSLGLAGYNKYLTNLKNSKNPTNNLESFDLHINSFDNQLSDLLPLYLRKSQAERMMEEKQNGNNNN